jgi:hypothetical protein
MWRAPANWPNDETLITTRQLANLLSVRPATVRRWKQDGEGPPPAQLPAEYPRGKQTLYRASDVKAWAVGNVRPRTSVREPDEHDDIGHAILVNMKLAAQRGDQREVARMKRKLTSRARLFAGAGMVPGAYRANAEIEEEKVEESRRRELEAIAAEERTALARQATEPSPLQELERKIREARTERERQQLRYDWEKRRRAPPSGPNCL